ncbi:hypothetical protein FHN55_20360 [Streptomyces sp. NP160]|uniref:hypothetical protein n=1 Tax=Streptomyces sp. NP160 TaxID=2586637 RepID=UPI00111B27E4|nr:hypothetical protein [Streptomyces sp. NP160]TNM59616.1 hypothetical protein FHN55_20360 [Streptomyces sp. NP160]
MKQIYSKAELHFPDAVSRPSVLRTVPLRWLGGGLLGLGVYVFALVRVTEPMAQGRIQLVTQATSVAVAVLIALVTWAYRRRVEDQRRVGEAVAGLVNAWNRLRTATGITAAIESNMPLLREAGSKMPSQVLRTVDDVEKELRRIDPLPSGASAVVIERWLEARYDAVDHLNQQLVAAVPGSARSAMRATASVQAYKEVMDAYSDWDHAAQLARASVVRWHDLKACVDAAERHVRAWWVYAVNDPRFWETDPALRSERKTCHARAKQAVYSLHDIVETRRLGYHPLQTLVIRLSGAGRLLHAPTSARSA